MFERKLFLGFQTNLAFDSALSAVDQRLLEHFIKDEGELLQRFVYQNQLYVGRFVEAPVELSVLGLLQENIYSLLKRLLPNLSFEGSTLWLLPVVNVGNL